MSPNIKPLHPFNVALIALTSSKGQLEDAARAMSSLGRPDMAVLARQLSDQTATLLAGLVKAEAAKAVVGRVMQTLQRIPVLDQDPSVLINHPTSRDANRECIAAVRANLNAAVISDAQVIVDADADTEVVDPDDEDDADREQLRAVWRAKRAAAEQGA